MKVTLHVPGMHNVSNALAAIALADDLGLSTDAVAKGLSDFGGADRRFQYKGCVDGVTIIDDYAHHPTEIRVTLTAAKNYPHKRLVLCFQPHTYSRTKAFLEDFADVLSLADVVVLADIYAAREKNTYGVSSRDILSKLRERGTECYYFPSFEEDFFVYIILIHVSCTFAAFAVFCAKPFVSIIRFPPDSFSLSTLSTFLRSIVCAGCVPEKILLIPVFLCYNASGNVGGCRTFRLLRLRKRSRFQWPILSYTVTVQSLQPVFPTRLSMNICLMPTGNSSRFTSTCCAL